MQRNSFFAIAALSAAQMALAACTATVQTSSGTDYLSRGGLSQTVPGALDAEAFAAAASVAPTLRFPARFGIARIEGGRLTPIPDEEMAHWSTLGEQAGKAYGEFVPLNLLVTAMVLPPDLLQAVDGPPADGTGDAHHTGLRTRQASGGMARARAAVDAIRLGAARQHLDAVLVYEVFGTSDSTQSALSFANLTILGAFMLPGSKVDALGHAEAILVDVRNGYPYLTASETVTKDGLAATARSWERGDALEAAAQSQAVADLAESLSPAFARLKEELGEAHGRQQAEIAEGG
jgi:hypothetical protein